MASRQRKSPTREERRRAWAQAGAEASSALLAPAFADPTFHDQYETALLALDSNDTAVYEPALSTLVELLHRLVPITEHDRADKLLGLHLTYDAERRAGRSEAEAHAAARSFRPLRYPLSADKDAAEVDLQGRLHLPLDLTRSGEADALRFRADVLSKTSPLGRPRGHSMTKEEWETRCRGAVVALKREHTVRTDGHMATEIGLSLAQFKIYKRDFGIPD